MATLNRWRVLYISEKPFLTAVDVKDHPYISTGPILTSQVIDGNLVQGGTVRTKSGTIYELENPLPENADCEFARNLLVERVSRNFNKEGKELTLSQLEQLFQIIDKILINQKS
jgi:hypothetical protein